jgi:hypothetical protein
MSEELLKFDPSTLMQGVKDRVKSTFVSLIPDEQWDNLVKKEVDAFFTESDAPKDYNYSKGGYAYEVKTVPSPFRAMVWEMCQNQTNRVLREYLQERFQQQYDQQGKPIIDDAIQKLIVENAGQMFAQMITGSIQSSMQNMYMQIRIENENQNRR